MGHLTSEQLIDLAEGTRPISNLSDLSMSHLESCSACQHTLAGLRATMSAVAGVEAPEPSPLFWDRFSARVHDAVQAGRVGTVSGLARWSWLRTRTLWVGAAAAAAVLAIAVGLRVDRPAGPGTLPPSTATANVEALVEGFGTADDPSLSLVADLIAGLDWEGASEAGFTTHVGVDNDVVSQLTEGERNELHQLLKGELSRSGA